MPMPIHHDQDDLHPLNRTVKRLLNSDGALVAEIQRRALALKPERRTMVISATIYGTSLIIRIYEAANVVPWQALIAPPSKALDVFWFTLQEKNEAGEKDARLVTINDPAHTTTTLGRLINTCIMLECNEFRQLDEPEPISV